jgi:hypothetical protein
MKCHDPTRHDRALERLADPGVKDSDVMKMDKSVNDRELRLFKSGMALV